LDLLFGPTAYSLVEHGIETVQVIKPDIFSDFVARLAPYAFLWIKCRLVRRKILQMNLGVALEKKLNIFASMPGGPVRVEEDNVALELFQQVMQHFQESLPIASGCSDQSLPPQQWRHPTRQIEPFVVLAIGWNPKSFAFLGPASSQAGMKAKAGLILKNNGLSGFKMAQFFLTPFENCGNLRRGLEDKHSCPVLNCSLIGAATSEPAELSTSVQNAALGVPPVLAHPRQLWAGRILGVSFPDAAPTVASRRVLTELGDPDEASVLELGFPLGSLHESSDPKSYGLAQTKRLPIPAAGPPKPATRQRSLSRSMPPELALLRLAVSLGLLLGASDLKLSCDEYSINPLIMQHYLVR